ncbi:GA module [Gardnerella pickettii]|uniref:GA module n=1 Tax=Gardnerella pickettii TaxID=2914924 RepID=UPI003D01BAA8
MRCNASWRNGSWWWVFVSSPAYADGYVDGTGNNIYYGFKTDAKYAEAHFNIDVEYYDTFDHAKAGGTEGKDPLGKFVRVHYLSNSNKDATADDWRFRPMWWFGVPAGLKDPQDIQFKRIEKLTKNGKEQVKPAGSSQYITTDANGYGAVSDKHFNSPKDWNNISNYYFSDQKILASKGWKQLMGLDAKNNKGYDDNGNTAQHWEEYKQQTQGLKGIFVDWESAGQRWYDMTYVSEMTDDAWKKRDENPLRFAAGVYRFAGNWHYAVGQKHNTPKIADHLKLVYPEVTKVKDPNALSEAEQKAIKEKIEKANENTKYFKELVADNGVVVNQDGSATITFKDNTKRTMPASLLVTKDESDSDKYKPTLPAATPVVNPDSLSDKDKQAVIDAFKKANEKNKDFNDHLAKTDGIKFDDNGKNLVVTYKDGSKATIPVSELVFQGPKISDWAPYVVPDVIEVDDLTNLKQDDITKIVNAFDEANKGITPYDEAKENNTGKKAPVTVDQTTGDATITWADGSKTTIAAWQFLKQKPKQNPDPSTPTPAPTAEKEFIVEAPSTQTNVNFDPFKMKEADLTTYKDALDSTKTAFKKKTKGKDAKDNSEVTITDVSYSVVDGKGYITFKADNYKDATYPMSVFFKKASGTQTPQTPSTETKTETGQGEHDTFKYKVTKTQIEGDTPTAQEAAKALKQFVKDNYDNVTEDDLATVADSVDVKKTWTPKTGTKNMGAYGAQAPNDGPISSFSIVGDDFGIQVIGHPWAENDDNGGDWSSETTSTLFTIKSSDLYVKKGNTQPQKDNTIEDLKKQAKDLLNKRKNTDNLSNEDLKRAGITDPDQLNDAKIDGLPKDQTTEKYLRNLIRKLTDAKKAERKYKAPAAIEVKDPSKPTEDDFKKAVKAFFDANYDGQNNFQVTTDRMTIPYLPSASDLKPKSGTVDMEIADDNIKSVTSSETGNTKDYKSIVFKDQNGKQLFTVSITYSKEETTPTPKPEDKQLQQMKDDAKKIIDKNPYLTPDQKKEFKNKIDNAPDEKTIKQILKDANDKGKENKNNTTDPNVQQIINNNKGGGDEKKQHELDAAKEAAKKAIDALKNLSNEEKTEFKNKLNGDTVKTPADVQKIVDAAKLADELKGAKDEAQKAEFVFLDHGKGGKDDSSDPNHNDDAALNELLGTTPAEDSTLVDLAKKLKKDSNATAEDIKNALAAAKRQNAINEENAKNAGIAKLDALLQQLTDAENGLNETQKEAVKQKVEAAKTAINDAKTAVNKATKPSDIKTAVDKVSIKDAMDAINTQVTNAQQNNKQQQENDNKDALNKEKEAQKKRIQDSSLPDADKQKAIDDINNAKKLGDPTGIADRALKAKKIEDALAAIDKLEHLNDAQKKAYKDIINTTDAGNHKDDNGNDTGVDDIDDALANAANTDNAMARLEDLKVIADKFANGEKYTGASQEKKDAFNTASTAAGAVLDKAKGDAKGAAEVNDIYADLLKAMQAIDNSVKGAGVKTDALAAEVESDKNFKPSESDSTKPGDSVYNTSSKEKKEAFNKALEDAEAALQTANNDNEDAKKPGSTPLTPAQEAEKQKAVDDALDKLVKARLALDGVNTKPLEQQIAKDADIKKSVEYTKASDSKKKAYDDALAAAQKIIDKLTGKKDASADDHLDTKENKQKALDAALKALIDAAKALDGKDTTPVPPSGDENPGSGSESDSGTGSGSDSGSGDSTSTSGGVNKQNLINQINTTENPGGANSGSGAAGTNPSTPGAGAQGAGMGAVAPGSGAGAAGTGAAGAANAGVDNKAVNNAVENAPEVKQADAAVKQAAATLAEALAQAKRVAADPHATQAQVDAAAAKLADARKALADAQANAAKVRAAVRSRVIKGMRSRGNAGIATGANVATTGLMATMIAAIGGAFATRRMRTKHANRD